MSLRCNRGFLGRRGVSLITYHLLGPPAVCPLVLPVQILMRFKSWPKKKQLVNEIPRDACSHAHDTGVLFPSCILVKSMIEGPGPGVKSKA
jgi:hypothetical protein